ncbi:hypothetical protein HZI73_22215 [Vallitalea pronyensis]|uniref:Uncharacterized protein n=1 Tax=Vallitalea pronyensis TaxID=1348613 RepID=A0A8J8MNV5_9FIRM|nr:hypothetical protein [Vallitalea pronyensis]QUI24847.1 hypothetical protein HZI73_22215 [Vallitalea pronyensis]
MLSIDDRINQHRLTILSLSKKIDYLVMLMDGYPNYVFYDSWENQVDVSLCKIRRIKEEINKLRLKNELRILKNNKDEKELITVKTKQKMTFLRKEKFEGISKKTNLEYSITNLFFLDDEYQEVKLGLSKECTLDLESLKTLKPYEVNIDIQLGNYVSANVLEFKAI